MKASQAAGLQRGGGMGFGAVNSITFLYPHTLLYHTMFFWPDSDFD